MAEEPPPRTARRPLIGLWSLPWEAAMKGFGKLYFERLLEQTEGRVQEAADCAGVDRTTVYRWK